MMKLEVELSPWHSLSLIDINWGSLTTDIKLGECYRQVFSEPK